MKRRAFRSARVALRKARKCPCGSTSKYNHLLCGRCIAHIQHNLKELTCHTK